MYKLLIITVIAFYLNLFSFLASALAEDWPSQFRNSANHNSATEQPVQPFYQVGQVPNLYFRPVIEGNVLIIGDSDWLGPKVVAYRLSDLSQLWEFRPDKLTPKQPVIYKGTVYFGVYTSPFVYSLSLINGDLRWKKSLNGETQGLKFAPLGLGDGLFVVGKLLHRLSIVDGIESWNLLAVIDSPLAADEQNLYIRRHDQRLSQVNSQTGSINWSILTNTTYGTNPVVAGSTVYMGTYHKIIAVDTVSGSKRWEYNTTGPLIGTLAAAGNKLFFSTNAGDTTAIDDAGRLLWNNRFNLASNNGNGWQSEFLLAGDVILAQADQENSIFINALNGERVFYGQILSSLVSFQAIVDRTILIGNGSKTVKFLADNWLVGSLGEPPSEPRIDPVIIVPGVLESWLVKGQWQLDPIFKTFDNLLATFQAAGYTDGLNLFSFPYDWHQDNLITANALKEKINSVKALTGSSKVDLVAHSMGGLISRAYIQSTEYRDDVDQLITLATPHHGSVKSYFTWEAARSGAGAVENLKEKFISYEAYKQGFGENEVDYVQQKLPPVRQLLPVFDYLDRDGQARAYWPCDERIYPCNTFLESLNSQLDQLVSRVSVFNFIAKQSTNSTLNSLKVSQSDVIGSWFHGKPINFPSTEGLSFGEGDSTVLTTSAHLDGVPEKILQSDHSSIVTDAASLVVKQLSQKQVVVSPRQPILRYLFIRLFSPISMLLVDSQGRKTGLESTTGQRFDEIPSAFYSGHNESGEYAIITNPVDELYKLSLTGTGSGEFAVKGSLIDDSTSSDSTQLGSITPNQVKDFQVKLESQKLQLLPTAVPTPCVSPTNLTLTAS